MKILAVLFLLTAFSIAAPIASSSMQLRLLVQQAEHLKVNENLIATRVTVLCTITQDTDLEMAQALLRHDHIDANLRNRWLEDFLILVGKGGGFRIANGFVVDGRRNVGNLKRSLYSARNRCIQWAIRSIIEDHNSHQPPLAPSLSGRIGGL
ncbi:unnamed protein product [Penicillium salamii]|nr:unnamed protein product [Penicillium salamii]CAG7978167.1 unnamed protein product [Penicillium salamii]